MMAQARIADLRHFVVRPFHSPQYESELITSPPLIVPSATQVWGLIELLMKWTEPSPKSVLTPPGCRLRDADVLEPFASLGPTRQHLDGLAVAE